MNKLIFAALVFFVVLRSGPSEASRSRIKSRPARPKHEGVCLLNESAPKDAKGNSEFLCFSKGAILKLRCDLSGEGSNVLVGDLKEDGKTLAFDSNENHGNGGQMLCSPSSST